MLLIGLLGTFILRFAARSRDAGIRESYRTLLANAVMLARN